MEKKRNTNTKEKIKVEFTNLLMEKGFDSLTVSDIARNSGINRGTFYQHYLDKYDLLEKLENETINEIGFILLSKNNEPLTQHTPISTIEIIPYESILEALYYVKDDFNFIKAISVKGGYASFTDHLKLILNKLVDIILGKNYKLSIENINIPLDYAMEILVSSVTSIIILWLKRNCEESPEEIARLICTARTQNPYELIIVDKQN